MKTNKSIIFAGKTKSGANIIIRYPKMSDLKEFWVYINKLSKEKTFVTYQGEKISLKEEGDWLKKSLARIKKKQEVDLSVFIGQQVIGMCDIRLSQKIKKHIGGLGLSIDKDYRGEGLGKLLMEETLKEAQKKLTGLKIVTLGVFETNKTAHSLYLKLGFKEYGKLAKGLIHNNKHIDEIFMYKEL